MTFTAILPDEPDPVFHITIEGEFKVVLQSHPDDGQSGHFVYGPNGKKVPLDTPHTLDRKL